MRSELVAAAWVAGLVAIAAAPSVAAPSAPADGDPAAAALSFYQTYISSLRHAHCPFDPSCSQYAMESIRTQGLIAGTALTADRLMRCNQSARRFYARGDDGRLDDPVGGDGRPRRLPRVPTWLVSPPADTITPIGPGADTLAAATSESIAFARALADGGDCERATTEYLRAAHAARTPEWSAWARLGAGTCFYDSGKWTAAESEFVQAGMLAPETQPRVWRLAAACRFNSGDFVACESLLVHSLDASPQASTGVGERARTLIFQGVCDMSRGSWDRAGDRFAAAQELSADGMYPAKLRLLATSATGGKNLPHKNAALATVLSCVIPGAGQIYAGRVQDGIRHLLFNGVLIYSVVALINGENYPAAVLVAGIELPFYIGNIRGAGWSARAFDRRQRLDYVAATLAATEE